MNIPQPLNDWFRVVPGFAEAESDRPGRLDLIGVDMVPSRREAVNHDWVPVIAAFVIAALFLAGVRMNVMRLRYAAAESVTIEQQLMAEKRDITVDLLRLREPRLLSTRATGLGFAKPDRVITFRPKRVSHSMATAHTQNAPESAGSGLRP